MISTIIQILNSTLKGLHTDHILYGIAESILRVQGSTVTKMPGIVQSNGEIIYVGIDDIYALIAYHKINSVVTVQLLNGTGDNFGDIRNTFNTSIFVYWDANKIRSLHGEMLMMVQSRIPLIIAGIENIKNAVIRLISANINSYQIYAQEYQYEEISPLPENKRIIQINYNIELTYKPECFKQLCPQC